MQYTNLFFVADALQDMFNKYINPLVMFMASIAGLVIIISIIVGGIQYSSAGGDSSKVAAAKDRISKAIVALLLFIFLFAFLNWLIPGGVI